MERNRHAEYAMIILITNQLLNVDIYFAGIVLLNVSKLANNALFAKLLVCLDKSYNLETFDDYKRKFIHI